MKRLLLGSGGIGRSPEKMTAWKNECHDFLGRIRSVLFIPYAIADYDSYTQAISNMDLHVGRQTVGIHTFSDPIEAIQNAEAIHVGGGNTFRLLKTLQEKGLLSAIRQKIAYGTPYLGISAGSNMACPSIKTTNDMPIVCPNGFEALGLISFQINPHYVPGTHYYYENHVLIPYGGETRDRRIQEFFEENETPVVALPEGSILRVENGKALVCGVGDAIIFLSGQHPISIAQGHTLPLTV